MSTTNDLQFVRRVVANLEDAGIVTWVFGGWAEELVGLSMPRDHHDVDLLYPAETFRSVDAYLAADCVEEICPKRFPHKRAFETHGIMVELFLVQGVRRRHYTNFWGATRHDWPANLLDVQVGGLRIASAAALVDFRAKWASRQPSLNGTPVSAEEWLQHHAPDGVISGPVVADDQV